MKTIIAFLLLCSAALAAPTSQPITVRSTKDLLRLSNNLHDKIIYVYPGKYDATAKTINWQRVLFKAKDANNPPTLRLPASQSFRWLFNTTPTTKDVTIQGIHGDFPGARSGFMHGLGGDQIRMIDCSQNVGNVLWCERRMGRIYIRGFQPGKPADKYQLCSFVDTVDELIVDERGADAWWIQGTNEADVRDMQSTHSVYLAMQGIGSGFKYWGQDRAGGLHEWIQCVISGGPHGANSCVTIGWMAASAGIKPNPLQCSRWIDSKIDGWTQENKTCKTITFLRVMVAGKMTTKTITNP